MIQTPYIVTSFMHGFFNFVDIDECKDVDNKYPCYGTCTNTLGSYTCKCKKGYYGDGKIQNGCRLKPFPVRLLASGNYILNYNINQTNLTITHNHIYRYRGRIGCHNNRIIGLLLYRQEMEDS